MMTRRFLLAGLLVLAIGGAVAHATTRAKKHAVSESIAVRVLTTNSTGATFTGTIKDRAVGAGALVIKAAGSPDASVNTISGTAFFKTATLTVKGSVTTHARADGSGFDYTGTATLVKATGVLTGATGKLKLAGSATASDPAYQTYKVTGTLKY